jgi:sirohydrochlorin cobaltochelatase
VREILLIGHGTRDDDGATEFRRMVRRIGAALPAHRLAGCFLEFQAPDIQDGVDRLVAGGATEIVAVPVLLLDAGHAMADIPRELARARSRHPAVAIRYGPHLGFHPNLLAVIGRVLAAVGEDPRRPAPDTALLMVGRGSRDPVANSNFYKFSRMVWEHYGYDTVENAFVGLTRPSLPEGLDRVEALGARRIVVVPYFLFTGRLYRRIVATVAARQAARPDRSYAVTPYFGLDPLVLDVVRQRVEEAVAGVSTAGQDAWMRPLAEARYGPREEGHSHPHDHGHEAQQGHAHPAHGHPHADHHHPHAPLGPLAHPPGRPDGPDARGREEPGVS